MAVDEVKDLEYYENNPDELPEDADELQALFDSFETEGEEKLDEDPDIKAAEEKEAAEAKAAEEAKLAEEKKASESKPVLKAKDGENEIPYSVLEKTRADLAEAEKLHEEAKAELEKIKSDAQEAADAEASERDNADLKTLGEEYEGDVLSKVAQRQHEKIEAQAKELAALRKTIEEQGDVNEKQKVADEEAAVVQAQADHDAAAQAAIDANPTLSAWQKDPDKWEDALLINQSLMSKEEWLSKPLPEICDEIVRRLGGPVNTSTVDDKSDVKNEIDTTTTPKINSLSDLPAGDHPAQSNLEAAANLSPVAISNMFEGMTSAQQDAYLATLD